MVEISLDETAEHVSAAAPEHMPSVKEKVHKFTEHQVSNLTEALGSAVKEIKQHPNSVKNIVVEMMLMMAVALIVVGVAGSIFPFAGGFFIGTGAMVAIATLVVSHPEAFAAEGKVPPHPTVYLGEDLDAIEEQFEIIPDRGPEDSVWLQPGSALLQAIEMSEEELRQWEQQQPSLSGSGPNVPIELPMVEISLDETAEHVSAAAPEHMPSVKEKVHKFTEHQVSNLTEALGSAVKEIKQHPNSVKNIVVEMMLMMAVALIVVGVAGSIFPFAGGFFIGTGAMVAIATLVVSHPEAFAAEGKVPPHPTVYLGEDLDAIEEQFEIIPDRGPEDSVWLQPGSALLQEMSEEELRQWKSQQPPSQ
jgi:predicted nucleic acid-binding Zn ribbon protein